MKLLFVADGRSPIALNWIRYFVERGDEVHLVSTFPCQPGLALASLHVIPTTLAAAAGDAKHSQRSRILRALVPLRLRTALRHLLEPGALPRAGRRLRTLIDSLQPDLVHAMRIPYEGMMAASALPISPSNPARAKGKSHSPAVSPAPSLSSNLAMRSSPKHLPGSAMRSQTAQPPLLVSVWGNDFTLHAPSTPSMGFYTRLTLQNLDALHTDCHRDLALAEQWGFDPQKPHIVLPGAGGVQPQIFYPPPNVTQTPPAFTVINPRGFRTYVNNHTFFQAIPRVLEKHPNTRFLCPAMAGETLAHHWVRRLHIADNVTLLPTVSREEMADLFRGSQIAVSPSTHDGTPNTLLEALACGCFPIAGDIESVREWITHGKNGLLFDPDDPHALSEAILRAIEDEKLRAQALKINRELVNEKAHYARVMEKAKNFYAQILSLR